MEKDLADYSIKLIQDLDASYVEARLESSAVRGFVLKNGIPQISAFDTVLGIGIRFLLNGTMGFVSTNQLEKNKLKDAIERAVKVTKSASRIKEHIEFLEEESYADKYEVKQKINLDDIDISEKIDLFIDADKGIRDEKGIKVLGNFLSYGEEIVKEYYINSDGSKIEAVIPKPNFYYFTTISANNKAMQRYWPYGGSGGYELIKNWDVINLLKEEVRAMKTMILKGEKVKKGYMDVVTGTQVTGIMCHESVGHPCEADRILGREAAQAGESFIDKDSIGMKIGSEAVTIVDDPTVEGGYGYYKYDNEGIKARRKFLYKNGIVTEFLHNRETSAKLGTQSNGSARASSYNREPLVRMSNTFLLPRDYKEEELFEDVNYGIFMKNFMEWNIDDKRLNQKYTGSECYLIEKGKITKPIYQPTLEITTPVLWKGVDAVANNLECHAGPCGKSEPMQSLPVWLGGPSMRIRNVWIS